MKWFGEPWPHPDFRAEVCSDDADRVEVPIGEICLWCDQIIVPGDQGVEIPMSLEGLVVTLGAYHVRCFLTEVVGDELADHIMRRWQAFD